MAGGVSGEWVSAPDAAASHVILCLHGGGFTMGSSKATHVLASYFSTASGCRALVIDYRLAPEHPFPAALEDTIAAYRWLLDQGILSSRIVIVGLSAGGGLALSSLVALRDAAVALPAGAVLISPWTDLAGTGGSVITRAEADPWLTDEHEPLSCRALCRHKGPAPSPYLAALRRVAGPAPASIQVGGDELMLDDSTRVAERAKAAGVEVTLDVWEGMWHVWHCLCLPAA